MGRVYVRLLFPPALLIACHAFAEDGEITGRVQVTRNLTRKKVSLPQVYDRSSALAAFAASEYNVEEELKRVVVYLEGAGLPSLPITTSMDQRRRRFEPEVLAVPVGSTVAFPNADPIFHNVFSLSKAKQFDLGNYEQGKSRSVTFDQPGMVLLHCHLHPNMSGAVLVTPNRFYARPDASGSFRLPGVPAGAYELIAWHKSAGVFRRKVRVESGAKVDVDFQIPLTDMASR